MSERLIEKIDRLGAEAGIETMTPEIRRFALLVRQDTVAQWPDLTAQQRESYQKGHNDGVAHHKQAVKAAQPEQDLIPKEDLFVCGQVDAHVTRVYAQPKQEPVAWMTFTDYGDEDDIWYENPEGKLIDGWTYKPLYTTPQPAQDEALEPLEYWNAVEGWVKIDEVRKHFDSVGCGTIYKTAGEDRTPLYTTSPKREWVGLTDEEAQQTFAKHNCTISTHLAGILARAIKAKLKELNK